MDQLQTSMTPTRALAEKPALAVTTTESRTEAAVPEAEMEEDREARVREAAYALYEMRGRADGHDVDDWLAVEASLALET